MGQLSLFYFAHACNRLKSGYHYREMSIESHPSPQLLVDDMSAVLHARILDATPIELLSDLDNKLVQVVQEPDGQTFVRRSYTQGSIANIKKLGLRFGDAWEAMHDVFADIGVDVVHSTLIETGQEGMPFVIASEYLADARPLIDASTESKVELAGNIGKLLTAGGFVTPHLQIFHEGTFMALEDETGKDNVVLVDVDPHLDSLTRLQGDDPNSAFFIRQVAELLWKECAEDQRTAVLNAFKGAVAGFAIDRGLDDTYMAFNQLQAMSNGVSPKDIGLFA